MHNTRRPWIKIEALNVQGYIEAKAFAAARSEGTGKTGPKPRANIRFSELPDDNVQENLTVCIERLGENKNEPG